MFALENGTIDQALERRREARRRRMRANRAQRARLDQELTEMVREGGIGERPVLTGAAGRAITANQPHAPPG